MEKKIELIDYLAQRGNFVTNKELQNVLNVSRRTIVNYVNEIRSQYGDIICSTSNGYKLIDKEKTLDVLEQNVNNIPPRSSEERKKFLLEKLLFSSDHLTIEDFANKFCISPNTLLKEITKFRQELKKHNLVLRTKHNELFITGTEKDKRSYMMILLNQELEESKFNIHSIQKYFTYVEIKGLEAIVSNEIQKNGFFLDDFSLLNYILHLAICIESNHLNQNQLEKSTQITISFDFSHHIQQVISDIHKKIFENYGMNFSSQQVYDTSLLLATRAISQKVNKSTFNNLESLVGNDVKDLLLEIIEAVHFAYGIDLKINNFMVRFAYHLKNMIIRTKNHLNVANANFVTIKKDFPFLYVIAVFIASIINRKIGSKLSENEISYIALHLGVLMEEKKAYDQHIKCGLVLFDYYKLGTTIFNNIKHYYSNLMLMDITTSYSQILDIEDLDLLITTLPIDASIEIPQVKIHLIPTELDYKNIVDTINEIERDSSYNKIKNKAKKYFRNDLFFPGTNFENHKQAIEFLCDNMLKLNIVTPLFKQAIYEHENCAPSAYGNIAIPHPLSIEDGQVNSSAIAVLINNTPIRWYKNQVDLVFMISLRREDRPLLQEIFALIFDSLTSNEKFTQLLHCNDFDNFIDTLLIK